MKRKRSKVRIVAALSLAVILATGLLLSTTNTAHAEDTTKVIQIGTRAIANPTESGSDYSYTKIYYGTWSETEGEEEPVLWRVLGDWDGTTDRTSTKLLLSEYILTTKAFNDDQDNGNTWSSSDVQKWCQDFAGKEESEGTVTDAFRDKELAAIAATSKDVGSSTVSSKSFTDAALSNEYVFLLSASEVSDAKNTYFISDTDRKAYSLTNTVDASNWWLRSGYYDGYYGAGVVFANGSIDDRIVYFNYGIGIRPAFNLDLSAVLFASAATGGKTSASEGGANALIAIADTSEVDGFDDTWKLTLRDAERGFSITGIEEGDAVHACLGSTITLTYTGATEYKATSTKDYISVIVMDATKTEALYYGRVSTLDAISGTVDITLPTDLTANTSYVLYVFSEEYNGDTYTDYASEFSEVTLHVGAHNLTLHSSIAASCTTAGCEAYYLCTNCGCMFADAEASTLLTDVPVLAALGHTYDSDGVCTVCGASKASDATTASTTSTSSKDGSTTTTATTSSTSAATTTTTSTVSAVADTATTTSASPKTADEGRVACAWFLVMVFLLAAATSMSRKISR